MPPHYLILNVTFQESPPYSPFPGSTIVVADSFKICIREHNAHAQVNAGFQYQICHDQNDIHQGPLCLSARIVYGGVSSKTFIAYRAQAVLINSRINSKTLYMALAALQSDLEEIGISTAYGNVTYRISVMQTCLYRSLLRCYNR